MKNKYKIVIGILISALSHSQLMAGPFISGQIGLSGYGDNNIYKNFDNDHNINLGGTGRLAAGYLWDLNDFLKLGLEAGANVNQNVSIFKSYRGYNIETKRWSIDTLAVADFFVTPQVDMFVKAGFAYVKQSLPGNFWISSNHAVAPKGAAGVGYNITPNVNLNLSLNHEFNKSKSFHFRPGASSVLAGIRYSFS